MINIISPAHYKTIPWKNGLGETTELAISEGGDVNDFDWRLSIASVSLDGDFSDFSGYARNLVLISGNGISLKHTDSQGNVQTDVLVNLLDMSIFDGGCKTLGELVSGSIKDFNIMTKVGEYVANVDTYTSQQKVSLVGQTAYFVYCLDKDLLFHVAEILEDDNTSEIKTENQILPAQHLLKISVKNNKKITLMGENIIVIALTETY
jgi:environmental stress-induced protein Ves